MNQLLNIDDKALIIKDFLPTDLFKKINKFDFSKYNKELSKQSWQKSLFTDQYNNVTQENVEKYDDIYIKNLEKEKFDDYLLKEIADIVHDIQLILDQAQDIDAETIRAIIVLAQMNLHIWHNEANYRNGIKDGNNLELTHGLNGIRNTAKNNIQELAGGRKDYKVDCLAADFKDWEISWK